MKKAIELERIKIPKECLKDDETFDDWINFEEYTKGLPTDFIKGFQEITFGLGFYILKDAVETFIDDKIKKIEK